MAWVWKLAAIGVAAVLVVSAFFAGWALAPGYPHSTGRAEAHAAQQDPMDEMTKLCTRHTTEMRPVMERMMQDMMRSMMR